MPRYIVLDIETIPHPDSAQWLGPVLPAANLKDPAKIAASIEERTKDRDDKLGLDPDCCQIVALGYHVIGNAEPFCDVTQGDEKAEGDAIDHLAWSINKHPDTQLVTFYGRQFDLPVVLRRAFYLGIKFPALNLDRYRSPHIDVWDVMTFNGALKTAHSLKFYCKRLGIDTRDPVDGAQVSDLAKAGRWDDIRDHCIADVGATHMLASKLGLLKL